VRFNKLQELQAKLGVRWPAIEKAILATAGQHHALEELLIPEGNRPLIEDASVVVFGSLGRGEWTSKSDLDWILLVDGQVDEEHFRISQKIRQRLLEAKMISPGTTGAFGTLAFSHDIVHRIGGEDDVNRNLTLRMLLLLESVSIGDDSSRVRVINAILERYLADDPSWTWRSDGKLPRFLLNDVVRFWRTMAVDFADKFHDQIGEKWALRNTKLRFSRRLIFLTGALACFSWSLRMPTSPSAMSAEPAIGTAISHFTAYLARPPLEILADELLAASVSDDICKNLFSSYNEFLAILDDEEARMELVQLSRELSEKSDLFQHVREISHTFRDGLIAWLFQPESSIFQLVRDYGFF
jgi:nucleotidyltransferase-like protein